MKNYKKNQAGYTHNIALLVLGVLVLGVVGFAGFKVYKNKSNASALAPNLVLDVSGSRITACKVSNKQIKFGLNNMNSNEARLFNYRIGTYKPFINEYKAEWIGPKTIAYRYLSVTTHGSWPYGAVKIGNTWKYGSITTPYYFRSC